MIKELLALVLSLIISLSTANITESAIKQEYLDNPQQIISNSISAREIANTYPYTYGDMVLDIMYLEIKYPDIIKIDSIGQSEWGFPIWAIELGKGNKNILINAAHHGREYATVPLSMKMINEYAELYSQNKSIEPYGNVQELLNEVTICFVPMLNVDGVMIAQGDLKSINDETVKELTKKLLPNKTFENWKANGVGIDLNANYPARWGRSALMYSSENSTGKYAGQAKGTDFLMKYTKDKNFEATISYHSAGEIVFWYFGQTGQEYKRDLDLATELCKITGYVLTPMDMQKKSSCGYKDWYIQEFKRPGFTIEIGKTVNNKAIPEEEMIEAWEKNKYVGLWLSKKVANME